MEHDRFMSQGKVFLVTGATRGIGRGTAFALARQGADVVLVGRSAQRLKETAQAIQAEGGRGGTVRCITADLSTQAGVRAAAESLLESHTRLDALINNVGATILRYQETAEGMEMTWALNYLGHFTLTHLLLGLLKKTAAEVGEARIVEVSSNMCRMADPRFPKLQGKQGYQGVLAYAQSKLAMNMFVLEMARRLHGTGVAVNAVTPGLVRTEIAGDNGLWAGAMMRVLNLFAKPVEKGVLPIAYLASDPRARGVTGKYFRGFREDLPNLEWQDPANVLRLWAMSERMTGLAANLENH
jgi:NAD(P)-dependent dehydrogenase (short-subunit alcohol dehydrogenase family)